VQNNPFEVFNNRRLEVLCSLARKNVLRAAVSCPDFFNAEGFETKVSVLHNIAI